MMTSLRALHTSLNRGDQPFYVVSERSASIRRSLRVPTFTGEPLHAWHKALRDRLHAAAAARGVSLDEFLRPHAGLARLVRA